MSPQGRTHIYVGYGCSGYFIGSKICAKVIFLGQPIIHLLFWAHETLSYFFGS